jgi:hypothetical protein
MLFFQREPKHGAFSALSCRGVSCAYVQIQNYNLSKVFRYLGGILVLQCRKIIHICFQIVEKTKLIEILFVVCFLRSRFLVKQDQAGHTSIFKTRATNGCNSVDSTSLSDMSIFSLSHAARTRSSEIPNAIEKLQTSQGHRTGLLQNHSTTT